MYTARNGWRRFGRIRAGGLALVTSAAVVAWGAGTAQASVSHGALRLTITKVVAGAAGDTLGWTYQAPLYHQVTGTIRLDVPAAFTAPQTSTPGSPGYVAATSGCAQFQVTGTAPQHDGSTMVTVAVSCATGLTGAISYTPGTEPTVAGKYVFAATFTPIAGTAAPFPQADIVTVTHAPLASLVISPASSTIATGSTQTYTVQGLDAFGNSLGNLTGGTTFTITPDGSCGHSVCTAGTNGPHTVTATRQGVTTTAALTVATLQADLSVTQTVTSTTPYYYAPVTFQTTVTNTSTVFWSDGISATVQEPPGLVSPVATPSGSTSYDPGTGTWTIGSLAPGASATLAISGDAGDVLDGTQTVTATVTATTPDPNPANNTASASEASQPAPIAAPITLAPGSGNAVDICANPPVTFTWDGAAVNAVNPAAPPPNPASLTYAWSCQDIEQFGCPTPANGGGNTTYISFISNTLQIDTYVLIFQVTPNGTDPNYQDQQVTQGPNEFAFQTTCVSS
ncbi:MAG TPA: DUF11 domain-containing protein [Pseudonocardiaceae bacterium]|nr:DUF11 domain-containing protein [Pseudonocardiaceae bacterium]